MKKKLLSVLLSAVLISSVLPISAFASDLPFTDIPQNAWYAKAVAYAYENGLFNGTGDTTFSPDTPMTRGMFVRVLANKTSNFNEADYKGKSSFTDVDKSKWYAPAIEWASKAGLVDGVGNGKFEPNTNVSREQMAKIMFSYAKKTGNDIRFDNGKLNQFSDSSLVASWAKEPMAWAITHGIVNGSGNKLNPKNNAKRCEVAQVVTNADPVLVKTNVEAGEEPDPGVDPEPEDPNEPDWNNPDPEYSEPLAPYREYMYDKYPNVPDPERIFPQYVPVQKKEINNGYAYVYKSSYPDYRYWIFSTKKIYDIKPLLNAPATQETLDIPIRGYNNSPFVSKTYINYETRTTLYVAGQYGETSPGSGFYYYLFVKANKQITQEDILSVYPYNY